MKSPTQQLLFYKSPALLNISSHADAGLSPEFDYGFSGNTNSIPLVHTEFNEVSKFYPIVFANNEFSEPVAVVGFEDAKNSCIAKDGSWSKNKYIPAYVRRYPFAFMSHEDKLILCVDEGAKTFTKKAKKQDNKFFENGEPTKLTQNALNFCTQYHNEQLVTQKIMKQVEEAGLLVEQQVTVTLNGEKGSKEHKLAGFKIIDSQKLRNIDDKLLREWHNNGILSLLYLHIASLSNFNHIA